MIEVLINNEWINVTNQILNEVKYDGRVDEVFDTGSFAFQSKDIDYNIAPLTHLRIDGKLWLCSSEANKIIPTEYWNHDVQLLELTYMTHTVIIGSKAFSNKGKYKTHNSKLKAIVELANAKNYALFGAEGDEYSIEYLPTAKNLEREFPFGAGTSLFQMLLEIGKSVNAIPRVDGVEYKSNHNVYHITWDYLDINSVFTLDDSKILGIKYNQDVENYTEVLEAEMQNVVDRDTIVEVKNLTVRSEDAVINSDNQVLILPSNAEEVVDIRVDYDNLPVDITIEFLESTGWGDGLFEGVKYTFDELTQRDNLTLVTNYILEKVQQYDLPFNRQLAFEYKTDAGTSYKQLVLSYSSQYSLIAGIGVSIKKILLEKAEFELLKLADQPKHLVYQSGSNKIENLYNRYKNDIWGSILNMDTGPALKDYVYSIHDDDEINVSDSETNPIYNKISFDFNAGLLNNNEIYYNPINRAKFNVKYKPVVNTFIKSDNVKIPFNESKIKHTSRSFEASASITDFNLLVPSINKTNEMLGMPEVTISYAGMNIPSPSNQIVVKGQNYYVSSIQTTITSGNYISYINLVSDYSKIADVFGVASQYESTKLPLNNIIERYVYCGEFKNTSSYEPTGIRLQSTAGTYYKRGVQIAYDNSRYLIISADDNYSFTRGVVENSDLVPGIYENKQYAYADADNEQDTYNIEIVREADNLTITEARDIPNLPFLKYLLLGDLTIKTHKDARERLIFVIKLI